MSLTSDKLRNIAIIAHVDHGKTTLVDALLKQSGTFRENQQLQDRMMDSMDLERERGITIAAKNTAIHYKDYKINIVDTPGHADFGGEVERILSMVDGACLLVDAAEGPLPQTRYVLTKALEQNLKIFVVINKVDRKDQRAEEVLNEIFDLFVDLGADDAQCDFPCYYAIARDGKAAVELQDVEGSDSLNCLFEGIVEKMPSPRIVTEGPSRAVVANLGHSEYLGRLSIGRVHCGEFLKGQSFAHFKEGNKEASFRVQALYTYQGLQQVETDRVVAGDIAVIAGLEDVAIGDSLVARPRPAEGEEWDVKDWVMDRITVDEPSLEVEFYVNNSPLAGTEGKHVTSRKIMDRLKKEAWTNVALRFRESDSPDRFIVGARGELQVAILAENMRREGFEFALGQPQILTKEIDGQLCEPIEHAILDIPENSQGAVTQMFQTRKGILQNVEQRGSGRLRLEFYIPSRALIGVRSKFMTDTCGEGLLNVSFHSYEPVKGDLKGRINGSLISDRNGDSNAYALVNVQERGTLFIGGGHKVYEGMIIGECARPQDLNVNACKTKQLTNFRTANKDDAITLSPPRKLTIESALEWIQSDELLEITPENLRLRKKVLAKNQ